MKQKPGTLIHVLPAIGNLGKILGFNPDFGRGIIKTGGFFDLSYYYFTTKCNGRSNAGSYFRKLFPGALQKS